MCLLVLRKTERTFWPTQYIGWCDKIYEILGKVQQMPCSCSKHSERNSMGSSEANRKYRRRLVLKPLKIMNYVPLWNKLSHKTLQYT